MQHVAALGQLHAALGRPLVRPQLAAAQRLMQLARQGGGLCGCDVAMHQSLQVQTRQQGGQEGLQQQQQQQVGSRGSAVSRQTGQMI